MRAAGLAILILAVTGCACRVGSRPARLIDPTLEALAPADTSFVTGANLDALRGTAMFEKYWKDLKLPQLDGFTEQTGLDPRTDLGQMLSCSNGKRAVFLARGKFGGPVKGLARSTYKGYALYGDERQSILLIDSSTAAAGTAGELRTIVNERDKQGHGLPAELKKALLRIEGDRQVWVAFVGGLRGAGLPENSSLGQALRMLGGIEQGTAGMDLRNGVDLRADLLCLTGNDARHVHDAIFGIVGIGKLSVPDTRPDLAQLYDAVHVTQTGTRVEITAQAPPAEAEKFLSLWLRKK